MNLFIHKMPFAKFRSSDQSLKSFNEIRVLMLISEPFVDTPPMGAPAIEFMIDTGCSHAIITKETLSKVGISLSGPIGGLVDVELSDGSMTRKPTRDLTLWLCSNLPNFANYPYRIDVNGGAAIFNHSYRNEWKEARPILGINCLVDAGIKMDIDFRLKYFSVWVPNLT